MTNHTPPRLAEILAAHGGSERWRAHTGLSSTIVTGGDLWSLKGTDQSPEPRRVETDFARQLSSITPFRGDGSRMTWTPERVEIEADGGRVVSAMDAPREAFSGHALETPWGPLHLAYFQGYAMWTYHALPFVLAEPGYEVREIEPVMDRGELLTGLAARFPAHIHSHSREQRFYFGEDGLLRRHDYEVEIAAGSGASHYLADYVEIDGLRFPTSRRVHPRMPDGAILYEVNLVSIDLSDYALR